MGIGAPRRILRDASWGQGGISVSMCCGGTALAKRLAAELQCSFHLILPLGAFLSKAAS